MIVTYILSLGIFRRFYGGGFFDCPKVIKELMWGVLTTLPIAYFVAVNQYIIGLALALNMLFIATGHGQYMDLGRFNTPVKPEKVDFIVKLFFGNDKFHSFKRDFFGLVLTGLLSVLGSAIIVGLVNPFATIPVMIGGAMKSVAYYLGTKIPVLPNENFNEPTEYGEFLSGIFAGIGIVLGIYICLI